MSEETKYCDMVDCPEHAVTTIGPDGKRVCITHAMIYQEEVADRMNRDGGTLH